MEGLEFVHTCLDDLLLIYNATFEEHSSQLTIVLIKLRRAGIKVYIEKSFFFAPEIEYCGCIFYKGDVKPVQKNIQVVLDLQPPTTFKQLRIFSGVVQLYKDRWKGRSQIISLLTDLVGK